MKKILSGLILLSLLFVLVTPMMVSAAGPVESCTLKHDVKDVDAACVKGATVKESVTKAWGLCCTLDGVYTATDWVFAGIMALVIIFILIGGFYILTAAGAPERVASGRQFIVWACIGLAVALGAKAIPAIVKALLGI